MGYDDTDEEDEEEPEFNDIHEVSVSKPVQLPEPHIVEEVKTPSMPERLVARAESYEFEEEDILPDVPVHSEHLGNGMNGDYVIHAQDHVSRSAGADSTINNASPSSVSSVGPGPHTTSPGMEKEIEAHKKAIPKEYKFPPISLLEKGTKNKNADSARTLKETALKLQDILKTFGVNVTVTDISQGPAVTRFELQPEAGVRLSLIHI